MIMVVTHPSICTNIIIVDIEHVQRVIFTPLPLPHQTELIGFPMAMVAMNRFICITTVARGIETETEIGQDIDTATRIMGMYIQETQDILTLTNILVQGTIMSLLVMIILVK